MIQKINKINSRIKLIQNSILLNALFLICFIIVVGLLIPESDQESFEWIFGGQIGLIFIGFMLISWNNTKKLHIGKEDLVSKGFDHVAGNRFYSLDNETDKDKIDMMYVKHIKLS